MATPLLAGTAALVREYFYRGFYPTGGETPENAFVPMGALVKAVLLHSARDLQGGTFCDGAQNCATGTTIGAAPDQFQGFGRAQMDAVLNFDSGRTFVDGKCPLTGTCKLISATDGTWEGTMPMVSQGTSKEYPISVKDAATSFRVTLVWHDPAM